LELSVDEESKVSYRKEMALIKGEKSKVN
jgi:hypothetical protein